MSAWIIFYFTGNSSSNSKFRLFFKIWPVHIHAKLKSSTRPNQKKHADISKLQRAQHPSVTPRATFLVLLFKLFSNRTFLCFPTEPHAQKQQQQQCNLTQRQTRTQIPQLELSLQNLGVQCRGMELFPLSLRCGTIRKDFQHFIPDWQWGGSLGLHRDSSEEVSYPKRQTLLACHYNFIKSSLTREK